MGSSDVSDEQGIPAAIRERKIFKSKFFKNFYIEEEKIDFAVTNSLKFKKIHKSNFKDKSFIDAHFIKASSKARLFLLLFSALFNAADSD